ncbi:beta HLH protein 71 [Hibiscus trionum]|uniref:Beta HLH protein 71 n=1 Tax=Hibiscus trionum TaxID=183268 RepID=A0A9W7LPZ2_HIBTR|nr:beta HLH protein 71 [Hibiscus trionum]
MALETLSSNELLNVVIYDTIFATPYSSRDHDSLPTNSFRSLEPAGTDAGGAMSCLPLENPKWPSNVTEGSKSQAVQGRRKRRRKPRFCKNKEEAQTQRMTHIAVERNRRKQMNEHLGVLRSLMPQSYVQRGDQASVVGGAIDFVKELEYLLQTLEARKLRVLQQQQTGGNELKTNGDNNSELLSPSSSPPFAQFFMYPQYTWSQNPNKYTSNTKASIADIEVTLIQTHANLRILSRKAPKQLAMLVVGFHSLHLSILHLNVTSMDKLVLYTISAKVEEGCRLSSVDDIAGAVHNMLGMIEEDDAAAAAALC